MSSSAHPSWEPNCRFLFPWPLVALYGMRNSSWQILLDETLCSVLAMEEYYLPLKCSLSERPPMILMEFHHIVALFEGRLERLGFKDCFALEYLMIKRKWLVPFLLKFWQRGFFLLLRSQLVIRTRWYFNEDENVQHLNVRWNYFPEGQAYRVLLMSHVKYEACPLSFSALLAALKELGNVELVSAIAFVGFLRREGLLCNEETLKSLKLLIGIIKTQISLGYPTSEASTTGDHHKTNKQKIPSGWLSVLHSVLQPTGNKIIHSEVISEEVL